MHLAYDKGNQLVQVSVQEAGRHITQSYRYDAFGRRLAKYNDPGNSGVSEESGTDYFGWDGDRLVHTERFNGSNAKVKNGPNTPQPEVIHTIYEPGSFTPLIQLRRAAKAEPDLADELMGHMQPGIAQDTLRGMLTDISATSALINERIGGLGMPADAQSFIKAQLQEFEETVHSQREENAKTVEVRHYLCDHLGTPNALIGSQGQIEWAATLDAWGNVKGEHNPKSLYQPIRLPGQHEDEGGLHYNRHRYYDTLNAAYLNQDPIGFEGGVNIYQYASVNPMKMIDPLGLDVVGNGTGNAVVYANMSEGRTIMLDSNGRTIMKMETRSQVTKTAKEGVTGPFAGKFASCERPRSSKAFGTAKWRTTDDRARWMHGGGSGLKNPFSPRQGWNPTLGCTRAQNEDVDKLCEKSEDFLNSNPSREIDYIRNGKMPNDGITNAARQ